MTNLVNLIRFLLVIISLICTNNARADLYQNRNLCEKNYGVWREFGNDCANNCESIIETLLPICSNKITFNCDCGQGKCWDFNNCVSIKSYQEKITKIAEEIKNKEDKSSAEATKQTKNSKQNQNLEEFTLKQKEQFNKINDNQENLANQDQTKSTSENTTNEENKNIKNDNEDGKLDLCNQAGGIIKEFSNNCANNCDSLFSNENKICATVMTKSCDCGEKKCWDKKNAQCIEIEKYNK